MCFECTKISRRGLFSLAASGALAAGFWTAGGALAPGFAKTAITPGEALAKLVAGNGNFVQAPELCAVSMVKNRATVATGQSPWATILTCADSRVSPELIFGGVGLGELFVARNAGNVADTDVMGTIEYGAEHLGSPLVVVMGHNRCGAVQAACDVVLNHTILPGSIRPMVDTIVPAAEAEKGKPGDFVENVMRENARRTAERVGTQSEIVHEFVHAGKVKVVYAAYDLDSGVVSFLG